MGCHSTDISWGVLGTWDGGGMVGHHVLACWSSSREAGAPGAAPQASQGKSPRPATVPGGCRTVSDDAAPCRAKLLPGTTWAARMAPGQGSLGFYGCCTRKKSSITSVMLGCAPAWPGCPSDTCFHLCGSGDVSKYSSRAPGTAPKGGRHVPAAWPWTAGSVPGASRPMGALWTMSCLSNSKSAVGDLQGSSE